MKPADLLTDKNWAAGATGTTAGLVAGSFIWEREPTQEEVIASLMAVPENQVFTIEHGDTLIPIPLGDYIVEYEVFSELKSEGGYSQLTGTAEAKGASMRSNAEELTQGFEASAPELGFEGIEVSGGTSKISLDAVTTGQGMGLSAIGIFLIAGAIALGVLTGRWMWALAGIGAGISIVAFAILVTSFPWAFAILAVVLIIGVGWLIKEKMDGESVKALPVITKAVDKLDDDTRAAVKRNVKIEAGAKRNAVDNAVRRAKK